MKLSDLQNHLEAYQREYGDVEVDLVSEAIWDHEELIQHIVTMEELLSEKEGGGLQVESPLNGVAYSKKEKRIKLMAERF